MDLDFFDYNDPYQNNRNELTKQYFISTADTSNNILKSPSYSQSYLNNQQFFINDNNQEVYSKVNACDNISDFVSQEGNKNNFSNFIEIQEVVEEDDEGQQEQQVQIQHNYDSEEDNNFDQQDLFIQNGRCQQIKYNNYKLLDKSFKGLKKLVYKYSSLNNLYIQNFRCSYDQNKKIFVIYYESDSKFCFFNIDKETIHEIEFKLKDNQLFSLDCQEQIIYISRQQEKQTFIDSFCYQIDQQQISLKVKNLFEIEESNIVYFIVNGQNIQYLYRQFEEIEEDGKYELRVYQNNQDISFKCILYDINNNSFAISNEVLYYNFEYIYNKEYDQEIQEAIEQYDEKNMCFFKQNKKYSYEQLKIKYFQNETFKNKIKIKYYNE
ncbi:hypothetical protein ABPG72_002050 [Tetrahymena utriculariae]